MADFLDYVILGAGAYYLSTKAQDKDEEFNRIVAAIAAGSITYVKGPDIYDSFKDPKKKDKFASGVVLGSAGYVFGEQIADTLRGKKKP
jgi:hypothetical protein